MFKTLQIENPQQISLYESQEIKNQLNKTAVKLRSIVGGICGSDISVFQGKFGHAKYPVIPGHEIVAEVVETGSDVSIPVGTKVVIVPNSFCDKCENCLKGRRNICLEKKSLGVNVDGVFSTYFCIDTKYVLPLPETISLERSTLTEPLAVIVHALKKVIIDSSKKIAIIGCGTEGMLATSLAHYYGGNITVIDIQQEKLDIIQKNMPNVKTFLPNQVRGAHFDLVVECAGVKSSVEQAFELVKAGGEILLVGLTVEATLPVTQIVRNEVTIYGSIIYDFPLDFETSLKVLADPLFKVDHIISKKYDLQQYTQAYEDACSGKFGKILIDFSMI